MSVVNKMLQDLESRQDQQDTPNADYVPSQKSGKSIWLIIVLVILLFAAAGYWWFSENQPSVPVAKTPIYVATPPSTPNRSQLIAEKKTESIELESQLEQAKEMVQQPVIAVLEPKPEPESNIEITELPSEPTEQASSFEVTASKLPNTEQSLKQQIQIALQLNDDKDAIRLLKKLLQVKPENQVARQKLASLLFAQGMMNESKHVIETGIRLQPDVGEYQMMLARFYVQQKNIDEAHNTLRALTVSAAAEPSLVSYRASLAKKLDRHDLAKLDYKNLLASQPSNAKWWLGLAISEEKLGNNNSALTAYRKVNELNQLSIEVTNFVQKRIQYLAGVL